MPTTLARGAIISRATCKRMIMWMAIVDVVYKYSTVVTGGVAHALEPICLRKVARHSGGACAPCAPTVPTPMHHLLTSKLGDRI